MSFEAALPLADALFYHARDEDRSNSGDISSLLKRKGIIAPRMFCDEAGLDLWETQSECLLRRLRATDVRVRLRFLQLETRRYERRLRDGLYVPASRLDTDGQTYLAGDERIQQEVDVCFGLDELLAGSRSMSLSLSGARGSEPVYDGAGAVAGLCLRERWPVDVQLSVSAFALQASLIKLRVRVENLTPCGEALQPEAASRHSLLSAHMLLSAQDGEFVSMTRPGPRAQAYASLCDNVRSWPVLAGERRRRDLLLCAPVPLDDYPALPRDPATGPAPPPAPARQAGRLIVAPRPRAALPRPA